MDTGIASDSSTNLAVQATKQQQLVDMRAALENIEVHYFHPLTVEIGVALVLVLLWFSFSALWRKSLRKSILTVGWSVSIFLFAVASIAWSVQEDSLSIAVVPGTTLCDFAGGIYRALLFHLWMLFVAVTGVGFGTCLLVRYWPQDKRD